MLEWTREIFDIDPIKDQTVSFSKDVDFTESTREELFHEAVKAVAEKRVKVLIERGLVDLVYGEGTVDDTLRAIEARKNNRMTNEETAKFMPKAVCRNGKRYADLDNDYHRDGWFARVPDVTLGELTTALAKHYVDVNYNAQEPEKEEK